MRRVCGRVGAENPFVVGECDEGVVGERVVHPYLVKKSFGSPDERRTPDKTEVEVVDLGSVKAARMTLQPGWRWSECIKPLAGTESCQIHHEGMLAAGQMHVRHDDGTEVEIGPGDAYVIEPGHDAWVIGSEAVVGYEFDSKAAETFARS